MIDDLKPECPRAVRHGLTDPAHTDNAKPLAADAVPQHRSGRPAAPFAIAHQPCPFAQAARHGQDQHHGEVRRIVGKNARRIGDDDFARTCGSQVDMFDPRAEIGDQAQPLARFFQHLGIDAVRHGGDDHIGIAHGGDQFVAGESAVLRVQDHVEQFAHPLFDGGQQTAGHVYPGLARKAAACPGVGHDCHGISARPGQGRRSSGLKRIALAVYQQA